jgi:hypothetical protein
VLLEDQLRARGVGAISRDERVRAFEDLHLPLTASLTHATVIKVGHIVGATQVIVGQFGLDGSTLRIDAHAIRIDVGRVEPEVSEQAPLTDLFASFGRLASRSRRMRPRPPRRRSPIHPTAFENYIKARGGPSRPGGLSGSGIKALPAYDRAELALWDAQLLTIMCRLCGRARAVRRRRRSSRARFLAGVSRRTERYDEAFVFAVGGGSAVPPTSLRALPRLSTTRASSRSVAARRRKPDPTFF